MKKTADKASNLLLMDSTENGGRVGKGHLMGCAVHRE